MHSYASITRSTSACVHFVDDESSGDYLPAIVDKLRSMRCAIVYIDCQRFASEPWTIASEIGRLAMTDHPPYDRDQMVDWVRWLDDLITLAHRYGGLVIIVDNADVLLASNREIAFGMIEAFLVQFHHWFEKEKPCHLCFQIAANPLVREVFESDSGMRDSKPKSSSASNPS